MEFPPPTPLRKSVSETLHYFDRFDYPLTLDELWFWQKNTRYSPSEISAAWQVKSSYYHLHGREKIVTLRKKRALYSQNKLNTILPVLLKISSFPLVRAIFITGALAMSNSPPDDDVDIMIIAHSNALWFTRPLVTLFLKLKNLRRNPYLPEHASARVSDKICDNLWLDEDHLSLLNRNLYTAHELLQARCVYDQGGIYHRLIIENFWAKDYLPIAYVGILKHFKNTSVKKQNPNIFLDIFLFPINYLLFIMQYLYMRPHFTAEKIGLGYAFFHPRDPVYNR